eukprot:3351235-Pleurochrysis_carterae.AAC.1
MYERLVKVSVVPLENASKDLKKALQDACIPCYFHEGALQWTLPQCVDERQSERTLMILGDCGCGYDTLLWMKQQFAIFLNAPSSEPQK